MTAPDDHNDDIALVGEYALHLLDADSRAAVEARLREDPDLRALLRDWDDRLVRLSDEIAEVPPPARVQAAIEARLFGPEAATERGAPARVWAWLFGRRGALFGAAALLAVALFVAPMAMRAPQGPMMTAEIAAQDRALVVEARFDPATGAIDLTRTTGTAATGRVFELWLIADGADAPVSLGVLPDTDVAMIRVPQGLREQMQGATLAISDEPTGGSPTGAPTGAVLAAGTVVAS
ncbi:anti-sigma factor domain-containing protein [Celeribacter sp.]|uniref:anti-sigma factor n=1 Tax=Celeribacter sp. TaxID=1890673 RepID=UPI003A8FA796